VCPQRCVAVALVLPTANAEMMSMHLAEIGRAVAPGAHAALILDRAGYHVAKDLAVPANVTLIPLPPYAPELNPMENVWGYLRGNKLGNTVFDSYDEIIDKASEAWMFFASDKQRIASIATRTWATVNL
jgi:transposase